MSLGLRQTLVLGTLCVTASVLAPFAVQSASTQRIRSRIPHANSAITMSERVVRVKGNGVVHAGNNQAKVRHALGTVHQSVIINYRPDKRHDSCCQHQHSARGIFRCFQRFPRTAHPPAAAAARGTPTPRCVWLTLLQPCPRRPPSDGKHPHPHRT